MRFRSLAAAILCVTACLSAHATSIVLESVSPGTVAGTYNYDYGIRVSEGGPALTIYPYDTIVLSGLSGVTNAFAYSQALLYAEYLPTLVAVVGGNSYLTFPSSNTSDTNYFNLLRVTSTSSILGEVNFSINTPNTYTGQVLGPVAEAAPTPEPASFALLGTGMVGLASLFYRYRRVGETT
jgi:hypothetical protein